MSVRGLFSPSLSEAIGRIEAESLAKLGAVAYAVEDLPPFADDEAANNHLLVRLSQVGLLLQALWFVKDNAATVDLGFLQYPHGRTPSAVTRNAFATVYSTASGSSEIVAFSREELRAARGLISCAWPAAPRMTPQSAAGDINRFQRAFYFVQAARSTSDLAIKIANYCTCFEALFSSEPQELTHKLAERVACFLEADGPARIRIFRSIKDAHAIRSRAVHGAKGARDSGSMQRASVDSDVLIRRCLVKILGNPQLTKRFTTTQSDLDEYFVSLVLTPPSAEPTEPSD